MKMKLKKGVAAYICAATVLLLVLIFSCSYKPSYETVYMPISSENAQIVNSIMSTTSTIDYSKGFLSRFQTYPHAVSQNVTSDSSSQKTISDFSSESEYYEDAEIIDETPPPVAPPQKPRRQVTAPTNGIVSFASDDWSPNDWSYRDIFVGRNVECTIYTVVNNISQEGDESWINLITLQNTYGYEIASHTINHPRLTELSQDQQKFEIVDSKKQLIDLGFDCKNFSVPFGDYNDDVINIAASVYRSTRISENENLSSPYNFNLLKTFWIDASTTIELQAAIDAANINNSWCILSFHSNSYDDIADMDKTVGGCIDYAKSKSGMMILTIDDALTSLGAPAAPGV